MSQYCSPESVFTPSPVTLVGAFVFGAAADFFAGAVCAMTAAAIAKRMKTITPASTYFVILKSSTLSCINI